MPEYDLVRHQRIMREDAQSFVPTSRTVAPFKLMQGPADYPSGYGVGYELNLMFHGKGFLAFAIASFAFCSAANTSCRNAGGSSKSSKASTHALSRLSMARQSDAST
jgi:hypothetical protein